jgi:hypothetical protein
MMDPDNAKKDLSETLKTKKKVSNVLDKSAPVVPFVYMVHNRADYGTSILLCNVRWTRCWHPILIASACLSLYRAMGALFLFEGTTGQVNESICKLAIATIFFHATRVSFSLGNGAGYLFNRWTDALLCASPLRQPMSFHAWHWPCSSSSLYGWGLCLPKQEWGSLAETADSLVTQKKDMAAAKRTLKCGGTNPKVANCAGIQMDK